MTRAPDKDRKAAERERMKLKGFKRFEAKVHPLDEPAVKRLIERLTKQRQ